MRKLSGPWKIVVAILSIALVIFQIYTAAFGIFSAIIQRGVHLSFILALCFLLKPATKKAPKDKIPFYDIVFAVLGTAACVYVVSIYDVITWDPLQWVSLADKIFGIVLIFLVIEASRRCVGWTFPIMAFIFMIYAYFGPYFPGIWGHQKIKIDTIFQTLYHSTHGVWGTMLGISSTMLAMFSIFSCVLTATGGSETFIKLGQKLTGKTAGGSGKVTLIASGLFGMLSGSAMANVMATGTFTIPMMKKDKFNNEWAAAISAVGSTGGQIMPPIMGAGAFVMSQLIGVEYLKIAVAAIVPAILYYLGSFVAVHFVAKRDGIKGEDEKVKIDLPELMIILIPITIFVILLVCGFSVTYGALYASVAGFIICALINLFTKRYQRPAKEIVRSAYSISLDSASNIITVAGLLAGAQVAISLISLTGFGVKMSDVIVSLGQGNLFLCLLLSMLVCLILGMGLPTTAAYVLAASVLAPALVRLGLDIMIAHLFVFFFSTISTITPPVCAAVYLSSGIAESKWVKTGFLSVLLALSSFIVPFTFVYDQSLLLMGSFGNIAVCVLTATLGVISIGIGAAGYVKKNIPLPFRVLLVVSGVMLVVTNLYVSLAGLVIAGGIVVLNVLRGRKAAA